MAMDDDFNTSEAIAVLFDLANEVNRNKCARSAAQLKALANILGLLESDPVAFLQGGIADTGGGQNEDTNIDQLIVSRNAFKKLRNFSEADRIRQELLENGIVLEDGPQGTTWRRT
jgi:cysteinyl-tRNA synthetase